MSKPNQPPFWLKITDEYVVANFDSLLQYVRNYNFNSNEESEEGDFLNTYSHLISVAHQYANEVLTMPLYATPQFEGPDMNTRLRIMGTALLTTGKIGKQDHRLLAAFVMLLTLNNPAMQAEVLDDFMRIINGCINAWPVIGYGFTWELLEVFSPSIIEMHLRNLRFAEKDSETKPVYEGHGTLVVDGREMWLAPFKYSDVVKRKLETELTTGHHLSVRNTGVKDKPNVEALINLAHGLLGAFEATRPTTRPALKRYLPGDCFMVRITQVQYKKVEGESIDSLYMPIRQNIYIPNQISFIPKEYLTKKLKEGDYLPVRLQSDGSFILDLDTLNDFVEDYANRIITSDNPDALAVYECDYKGGTRWLTEDGLIVSIYENKVNPFVINDYHDAIEQGLPCEVRLISVLRKDYCIINAEFRSAEPTATFTKDMGYNKFVDIFLEDMRFMGEDVENDESITRGIPEELIRVLALLAYRLGMTDMTDDTYRRVETLITALLTAAITGNSDDVDFIHSQFDFQRAAIGFAHGATPDTLAIPEGPQGVALLNSQRQLVECLRDYREVIDVSKQLKTTISLRQSPNQTTEAVRRLITASNGLLDKIDLSEINRIKKAICTHLGVEDEFKSITSEATNYGVESDFLEFKSSCVNPPAQWDTGNLKRNMTLQQWNILKAVCAFLNSSSGGELLIGVNDSGFAVGLEQDLRVLHSLNSNISTLENLRTSYLKLIIDQSFASVDGSAKGSTITAERVQCDIETNTEGVSIIRVKVRPYEFNVVKIIAADKPDRFTDCYIRTSGASTPMNKDAIRETKIRKMSAMERINYKLSKIMEAIDNQEQVVIKNYSSSSGVKTRHLEPYKITDDNRSFIAFDTDLKKVRMFRLSRFASDDVQLPRTKWRFKSKHLPLEPDIFGILENEERSKIQVQLLLTDYARNLLLEETPLVASSPALSQTGQRDFPWKLTIDVNGLMGVARFVMGLPLHVKVVDTPALAEFIMSVDSLGR